MGCSSSNNSTHIFEDHQLIQLNSPLHINLQLLNSTCDSYIKKASESLLKFELIRQKIIDEFDNVILSSGGYVLKEPTAEKILKFLIFVLLVKRKGNLSEVNITCIEDPPYISIKNSEEEFKELTQYIVSLSYTKTTLKELNNDIPTLFFIMNEVLNDDRKKCVKEIKEKIRKAIETLQLLEKYFNATMGLFRHEAFIAYCHKCNYDKQLMLISTHIDYFDDVSHFAMHRGLSRLVREFKDEFNNISLVSDASASLNNLQRKIQKKKEQIDNST